MKTNKQKIIASFIAVLSLVVLPSSSFALDDLMEEVQGTGDTTQEDTTNETQEEDEQDPFEDVEEDQDTTNEDDPFEDTEEDEDIEDVNVDQIGGEDDYDPSEFEDSEIEVTVKEWEISITNLKREQIIEFDVLGEVKVEDVEVLIDWQDAKEQVNFFTRSSDIEVDEVLVDEVSDPFEDERTETDKLFLQTSQDHVDELTVKVVENLEPQNIVQFVDTDRNDMAIVREIDYTFDEEVEVGKEENEETEVDEENVDEEAGMGTNIALLSVLLMILGFAKIKNRQEI